MRVAHRSLVSLTTHIALLRGINVGGHRSVGMTDLRNFLTKLGFDDVRSLLQSGNVVFGSRARTGAELERFLEAESLKQFSMEIDFFVRAPEEWKTMIRQNPFRKEAELDPGHLIVMLLKSPPRPEDVAVLQEAISGREIVRAKGRHLYPQLEHCAETRAAIESWIGKADSRFPSQKNLAARSRGARPAAAPPSAGSLQLQLSYLWAKASSSF